MKKELEDYYNTIYPFHMPGHKLGRINVLKDSNIMRVDTTEVEGTDNLYCAEGIISAAHKRAAKLYNSEQSYFLINGSTGGILAAISAVCRKGDTLLMARNCHKSVFNGVMLNELKPIYLYPDYIEECSLLGGINPEQVRSQLESNQGISAVFITSPTYEGFVSDIEEIAAICHEKGKILIVDEAHGAHFGLSEYFPKSSIEMGADIVIQSMHKTLPVFTQTGIIHINGKLVDRDRVRQFLEIYQSSSPSYIFMTALDECIKLIEEKGVQLFESLERKLTDFREKVNLMSNIGIIGREIMGKYSIYDVDLSKLLFIGKISTIKGKKAEQILRNTFMLQMEMSMDKAFLGITTIADQEEGFLRLSNAIKELDDVLWDEISEDDLQVNKKNKEESRLFDIIKEKASILPADVINRKSECIELIKAEGRIAATNISVYPPGIPVVVMGEILSECLISYINKAIQKGFFVNGIEEGRIKVVK